MSVTPLASISSVRDGGDVVVELTLKLAGVADIVYTLVEAACKLRSDRTRGNALIGNCGENHQQFIGRLGQIGLVERNLRDETVVTFRRENALVDPAGLLHSEQVLAGSSAHLVACEAEGASEIGVALYKGIDGGLLRGLAYRVSHVEREEIRGRNEAVHGGEVDVIGIHSVGGLPAERGDGAIGLSADTGRLCADDHVLAIALVPDRGDHHAGGCGHRAGVQLCLALLCETVTYAERESTQDECVIHGYALTYQ